MSLKNMWRKIMNSMAFVRWAILLGSIFIMMRYMGFDLEEFRVTVLIIWYLLISTVLSMIISYIYGKINYHNPDDSTSALGQIIIFAAVAIATATIVGGTYIAQYN